LLSPFMLCSSSTTGSIPKEDSLTEHGNSSFRENNCVKQQQYAQFKATVRMK